MRLRCEDFGGLGLRCDAGVRRWWLGLNLLAAAKSEMQLAVARGPALPLPPRLSTHKPPLSPPTASYEPLQSRSRGRRMSSLEKGRYLQEAKEIFKSQRL